jgi:hypothetical protein
VSLQDFFRRLLLLGVVVDVGKPSRIDDDDNNEKAPVVVSDVSPE